ncbi:hypothetical protein ASE21_06665 [Flavobacterium sp. Root901]|uniref:GNAT family N-acetyltransferase n=1 Tax=Flavobacterium sp. Root901 TaxID=1736605 RepID=UPI000709D120|nr:GNAT family N-acetyltransferase [Flavobacterium sp. Root901]KRD11386.1 hypothetical protein ASE21_06665 [Flavobacterium sp. Root901]
MKIIKKDFLSLQDKEFLLELWNNEYPEKLNYQTINEFDVYLDALTKKQHYFLINDEGKIQGWAFTFLRDNEDWFAIILDKEIHGKGKGSLLMNELKKNKENLNGWVIDHENDVKQNKELYKSPLLFYIKNGFTICAETRIENQKMSGVKINWNIKNK